MARIRNKAPLLAVAFGDGADHAAGKEPYQHEHGRHARRGDAHAVHQHAAEARQHASAVQKGNQRALVHSIAGKAVILNKTGGAAIGIGIRRVLGDGGLIDSKNLIVIDGLHISRVVQHGRKEANFIGQFGGLVAVAGASPVNGLYRHGQLARMGIEQCEHAVGVMDDFVVVEHVDNAQDHREHQQHGKHADQNKFDAELSNHGISSSE